MNNGGPDSQLALRQILEAAVREDNAIAGNMQMLDATAGALEIIVHRGFPQAFLDRFRLVHTDDPSICGRAFRLGRRVAEFDVSLDPQFAPYMDIAQAVGFISVQSTPILDSDGCVIGVLSTHFAKPHRLSVQAAAVLDAYACQAGKVLERIIASKKV